jgi:Regulator of chromosome condensation (RCC1) repeat
MKARASAQLKSWAVALLGVACLAACGGGGGGGGGGTVLPAYTIGGTASGLTGTMTLQNSGADNLSVAANGNFTFAAGLTGGSAYSVTVLTPPPGQTCTVVNGAGSVAGANVTTVAISCATTVGASHTVGGTVSGLVGTLVLQDNGGDTLSLSADGSFAFATLLATGSPYAVTVLTQPAGQTCVVANGTGTVASANVANIGLTCSGSTGTAAPSRLGAGFGYTLAVRADGKVLSFGSGMEGGSGTALAGTSARVISGLSGVAGVWAGPLPFEPSLALAPGGTVLGWGRSLLGASVTGVFGFVADAPIAVDLLGSSKQVAVCPGQSLPIAYALHGDGSVSYVPATSVVANNGIRTSTAKTVSGLGSVVAVSEHCAQDTVYQMTVVKSDGTVWNLTPSFNVASGPAPFISTTTIDMTATQVIGLPAIASVSCGIGQRYCLARATDGHVWAWGDNTNGQLGDGTTTGRTIPIQVPGLASIARVVAGDVASYAVTTDGLAYSWGGGPGGGSIFLGRAVNADASVPKPVTLRDKVVGMAASTQHVVVQLLDGSVWGWGTNVSGELGDGTSGNSHPLPVQALGINLN